MRHSLQNKLPSSVHANVPTCWFLGLTKIYLTPLQIPYPQQVHLHPDEVNEWTEFHLVGLVPIVEDIGGVDHSWVQGRSKSLGLLRFERGLQSSLLYSRQ